MSLLLALALIQTGPATVGLPATPKELATTCSGLLLAELGRQANGAPLTDLTQAVLLDTSGKWMKLLTLLTGKTEDQLMDGEVMASTIDAASGANLKSKAVQVRFCAANAPARRS